MSKAESEIGIITIGVEVKAPGDNHQFPKGFPDEFKAIWKSFFLGEISPEQRMESLKTLLNSLPPDVNTVLKAPDREGKTPLSKLLEQAKDELNEEQIKLRTVRIDSRTKMGEGKKPPKSKRTYVRRQKAQEGRRIP